MNKMKLYQFELFLSFLFIIINTTLSGYIPQLPHSLGKQIDKIKQSPPSDEQPTEEIQGLSQIKKHLDTFGYFRRSPLDFDDVLDKETISAIKTYQQFFNLQVTGHLNNETLQQILLPRCGVPDMRYKYGFAYGSDASFPKGNKWFPKGRKKLTYGFLPENRISIDFIKGFGNAFTRWSQTTKVLNFSETTSYDDADIKIGFYNAVDDIVVGDSFISLNLDSNVKSGMIRLDISKIWVLPTYTKFWDWKFQEFDLETAVMHQIGHLLGLDHSSDVKSIMYPTIVPLHQKNVQITDSDNQSIQQLYTNTNQANTDSDHSGDSDHIHSGCFKLFESSFGTYLSLGFAFMALMNLAF